MSFSRKLFSGLAFGAKTDLKNQDKKLLYSGTSLELFLRLKRQLEANKIKYLVAENKKNNWFCYLFQLFVNGTGSRGTNNERTVHYTIYVTSEDYERVMRLSNSKIPGND